MRSLAYVLLIAFCVVGEFCSDLLIRARGLDGVHGINAYSYDVVFSVGLGIGVWLLWTRDRS